MERVEKAAAEPDVASASTEGRDSIRRRGKCEQVTFGFRFPMGKVEKVMEVPVLIPMVEKELLKVVGKGISRSGKVETKKWPKVERTTRMQNRITTTNSPTITVA